jgi:formiminotetrahydrofolate cyclodeaminase
MREEQLLEHWLAGEVEDEITLEAFLEATASSEPTPGGGSVAALSGSLAAALTQMVAGLTIGRKRYAGVEGEARAILANAADLRRQLTAAISEDAAAFDQLIKAMRDQKLDPATRAGAVEQATVRAAEVPLQVARLSRDVARLAQAIARIGNVNAVTDAAAAAIMARAAVQAAALNVKVNLAGLTDQPLASAWRSEVDEIEAATNVLSDSVVALASERGSS